MKINRQLVLQLGVNNSDEELREDGIYGLCDVAHNPSSIISKYNAHRLA